MTTVLRQCTVRGREIATHSCPISILYNVASQMMRYSWRSGFKNEACDTSGPWAIPLQRKLSRWDYLQHISLQNYVPHDWSEVSFQNWPILSLPYRRLCLPYQLTTSASLLLLHRKEATRFLRFFCWKLLVNLSYQCRLRLYVMPVFHLLQMPIQNPSFLNAWYIFRKTDVNIPIQAQGKLCTFQALSISQNSKNICTLSRRARPALPPKQNSEHFKNVIESILLLA